MKKFACYALLTPLAVLLATAASAHQSGNSAQTNKGDRKKGAPQIEAVIVTARKRVENIQSIAATVTAVSQNQLANSGFASFRDLSRVAPGLNISNSPTPNIYAVKMRGLGTEPGNPSFDDSISLFVDGVYTARDREFSSSLFDMKRIEVIRGTEAALLGKNTSLGAVNLVTNKPGDVFEADIRYQHEFNLNSNRAEGGVDIPLSDDFAVRIAGVYDDEGGPVYNQIDGSHGLDTRVRAGRITAVWTPSSSLKITAMYQGGENHSDGASEEFISATPIANSLAALAGYPGTVIPNMDYKTSDYSPKLGAAERYFEEDQRGALTVNWTIGDYTLTAQSGYTGSRTNQARNVSFLPSNFFLQYVRDNSKQFTQELRLTSPSDQKLNYIVGVFYLDGRYINYTTQAALYPAFGGLPPITGSEITYFNQLDRAYSAFGQANYQIYGPLTLTAGLRYTNETKSVDFSRNTLAPGLYTLLIMPPYAPFRLSKTEGSVDGSVGLKYQVRHNILLYTTWGQGTKAGGFAQAASFLDKSEYSPEVAQTVEVGIKSQFDELGLTVNAAAFDTGLSNYQLVSFNGVDFTVGNTNLRSVGIESEISWQPVRGLRISSNNTYAHVQDTSGGGDISFSPRWSGNAGVSYDWSTFNSLVASVDVDINYHSKESSQAVGVPVPDLQASTRLDMSVGLANPDQGWEVRLLGKNLNDEHVLGFDFPAPLLGPGNAIGVPLNPRTIMIQLSYRY